jgi:uncharacterized protein (DUF1800 family)
MSSSPRFFPGRTAAAWSLCLTLLFGAPPSRGIIDLDHNGWSDLWEAAYGPGTIDDADDDGDHRTNRQEHDEGTDPHDAGSLLPDATAQALPKGKVRVSWATVHGKWHQLQVSFDDTTWSNLGPAQFGSDDEQEFIFAPATQYLTGGPLISRWRNVNGNLATIKTYATNGTPAPTESSTLLTVETKQTSPDQSNFGQWVRGWIIPPATGKYTFWIASDDAGELWLSPSAIPEAKQLIGSVSDYTNFRQWDKFPSQKSTPKTLKAGRPYYFEAFQKEGGGGDHLSIAWTGPKLNADKEIIAGTYVATDSETIGQKLKRGETPTYRVRVFDQDSDGDTLTDWEETLVGLDPNNPRTVSRVKDLQTLTDMFAATNVITVGAEDSRGYEKERKPLKFTFFRSGNVNPLTVQFTVSGTAKPGEDFQPLAGTVQFGVGQTSSTIEIVPEDDALLESAETMTVTLANGASYQIGNPATATATIDDAADVILVATLRPVERTSGGYGTVAMRMAGNKVFADAGLSFGNLTSDETAAEIYVLGAGGATTPVYLFASGQVPLVRWDFAAAGGLSHEQILAALDAGKLYARVSSERFPNGEIIGAFVKAYGWTKAQKPPSPGAALSRARNDGDAARFLTQASFGPTADEIRKVKKIGFAGWINDQFKRPAFKHLAYVQARRAELRARSDNSDDGYQMPRQEAWWQAAVSSPDQLRQRLAFALSEIMVVSDVGALEGSHEGLADYYDMLCRDAFGNFRKLLEDVTLSPIMGQYLSMVRNQKPNPNNGSQPDENYAREIMQLMSIGLNMLNPDGSLALNPNGLPTPTYVQSDIVGLAHVFTGWGFNYDKANPPDNLDSFFLYGDRDELHPMIMFPKFHDPLAKRIVGGANVPAGLTGEQDLKFALDTLFNHPNVGPFISRQLIQRFVTSNPSRGYIYRVAAKFNNNGHGVRGDLKAVIRAVLLDAEARNPNFTQNDGFGKLREPVLRASHLLRAFDATKPLPTDQRYFIDLSSSITIQGALKSSSVFNFFQPGYIPPGKIAAAGLFAPEFQITSETSVISLSNVVNTIIYSGIGTREQNANNQQTFVNLDLEPVITMLSKEGFTPEQNLETVLNHLDVLLCSGQMTLGLRQSIKDAIALLPSNWDTSHDRQRERVRLIAYIIATSPEYCVQK